MKTLPRMLSAAILTGGLAIGGNLKGVAPVDVPVAPITSPTVSPLGLYIGLGILATFIERDACPCAPGPRIEDHRYGSVLRIGYDFNPYIGIEARGLKTLQSNAFSETTHYGLYLKPQYHIADQFNAYALIGYGRTKIHYTNGILQSDTEENGLSYGAGVEYDFAKSEPEGTYTRGFDEQGDQEKGWGVWIDIQRLLHKKGMVRSDVDTVTVGVTYDF